jgi:hypothetical protein
VRRTLARWAQEAYRKNGFIEFQWPTAGRMFERGVVFGAGRFAAEAGEVPPALQSSASAQRIGGPYTGSLSQEKASTSMCTKPV